MSIYNRDYMRDEDRHRRASGPATWSVVIWLIVVNLAVYVVNNLLLFNPNRDWFGLSLESLASLRLWTPVTFQFVHANLWHLIANLLGLFFLGRLLLQLVPSRQVLRIYLLGGLAGGAFQLAWNAVFGDAIVIGASASVLAITFAAITLVPYQRVNLLLFFHHPGEPDDAPDRMDHSRRQRPHAPLQFPAFRQRRGGGDGPFRRHFPWLGLYPVRLA